MSRHTGGGQRNHQMSPGGVGCLKSVGKVSRIIWMAPYSKRNYVANNTKMNLLIKWLLGAQYKKFGFKITIFVLIINSYEIVFLKF